MILCISLNPAIDKRLEVPHLEVGKVNRARSAVGLAGGKATHVALVANALGARALWLGFAGGASGAELAQGLRASGVEVMEVPTQSHTRVNLEILDSGGVSTEVLEPGGAIRACELEQLLKSWHQILSEQQERAKVVLSGSLPPGVPTDIYAQLIRDAHDARCQVFLDTSGDALRAALPSHPDFVTPNREEAEDATGCVIIDYRSAAAAAMALRQIGARTVVVSLGSEGLLACGPELPQVVVARAPIISGQSSVGCGDAAIAGLAVAFERRLPFEEAVRLSAACGAANCLADAPGMVKLRDVERILPTVTLERIAGVQNA
jgi:1-phosphofructokinase family hexose kinase